MQALVLAGGEGTRLRPLTLTTPKPVMPLAGRPFLTFMLSWLARHGVDDAILSCGPKADPGRPMQTFAPGCTTVPRWRTRICPAFTICEPYTFTPSRCEFESRPLRDEPIPFL